MLIEPVSSERGRTRRLRLWLVIAVVILMAGSTGALLAAQSIANHHASEVQDQFTSASTQITSTLQLEIQQEEDLIISASAFIAGMTSVSNTAFAQWADSVQALSRYPELQGLGEVVIVPATQLAAFEQRALADPAGPLPADGTYQVVPAGSRPQYCLLAATRSRSAASSFPAGYDYCTGNLGAAGLAARDSGKGAYFPIQDGASTDLVVMTPVYQDGTVPATVAARRAAFLGWVGMSVVPQVLLQKAIATHPHLAVRMQYHANSSSASFQGGTIAHGASSTTTNLGNGWTVDTFEAVEVGGLFHDSAAVALLVAGVLSSLLLATLLIVLATGRTRALLHVRARTNELRHQAFHDALTGLPNRTLIQDRIEQLLARSSRSGTLGAALYVDLDGFKNVNDTLGHGVGDQLLRAVAARLTATLRDVDTIGRMGGDEFVVLIDGTTLHIAPELVAERLLEVIRQPFLIDGVPTPIVITASIGIAAGSLQTQADLLRNADMALYQAKAAGKNCYETFGEEMGADILHRYELEFDLRIALEENQFRLLYQPMHNLANLKVVGVEALLRWEHPTLGLIRPDEFIPLLEASGQIIDVGRWVLHEACNQMAAWRAMGHPLSVSVNVSGRQLDRDSILDHVREALATSGLDPAALTIEITETALMRNIDTTTRRLRELKALGVMIAIDDFGTGYSSLAYLQRFPVDCLKIDKSFTDTISRSRESDALIHTLLQLGQDLGLKTVAEGVETQRQVDYLRSEQVTEVQGFLFAKPLDATTFEMRLHDSSKAPVMR